MQPKLALMLKYLPLIVIMLFIGAMSLALEAQAAPTNDSNLAEAQPDAVLDEPLQAAQTLTETLFLPIAFKAPPDVWVAKNSGTTQILYGVDCPSTTTCYAVGAAGTVLKTLDGGENWTPQASGVVSTLRGIDCFDVNRCFAVGDGGVIRATADGGAVWTARSSGVNAMLYDVHCATTDCLAVGGTTPPGSAGSSIVVPSFDSGNSWQGGSLPGTNTNLNTSFCPNDGYCIAMGDFGRVNAFANGVFAFPPIFLLDQQQIVFGLSCRDGSNCMAVGGPPPTNPAGPGVVHITGNSGQSWATTNAGVNTTWNDVSCVGTACFLVGNSGSLTRTPDFGATWVNYTSPTGQLLYAVDCPSFDMCVAVGFNGTIVTR